MFLTLTNRNLNGQRSVMMCAVKVVCYHVTLVIMSIKFDIF